MSAIITAFMYVGYQLHILDAFLFQNRRQFPPSFITQNFTHVFFSAPFLVTFGNPSSSIDLLQFLGQWKLLFFAAAVQNLDCTARNGGSLSWEPQEHQHFSSRGSKIQNTYGVVSFQREQQNQVLLHSVSQCLNTGVISTGLLSIGKCSDELQRFL